MGIGMVAETWGSYYQLASIVKCQLSSVLLPCKLAELNEHEPNQPLFGTVRCSNRTEQTFMVRLRNRTRTVQGACSVRFANLANTNRDEQALRCSVRFGSVRRAHSAVLFTHIYQSVHGISYRSVLHERRHIRLSR